ncbi:hypothetical protein KR074_012432 [Drosophila pseudoananassae]|nr:hypothetical protein KR074_012432 [Drosophila pseudoananassae]
MTARQRAMHKRAKESFSGFEEELIALPSGYKEKEKPQTEEEIKRATLKSQKRKQQADERREKDKRKTMDRLLKKQETNKQRSTLRNKKCQKSYDPKLIYVSSKGATYILIPPNQEFPIKAQKSLLLPPPKLCFVADCGNPKAYTCSKTKVPLCSLVCYRKNLLGV